MKFFVISRNRFDDREYAFGEPLEQRTGDFEKCDVCESPVSMRKWLPPFMVKLSKPSYGDFVYGTFETFLVSERFKQKYEEVGLKGIKSFEPIEVTKVNRKKLTSSQPPQYYYVTVVRSKTRVDEAKSKFVRDGEVDCESCQIGGVISSFEGVFLIQDTWDGEDIFFPKGLPGTLIVSQRFYDFVINNDFSNIVLVPAETYKAPWA